MPLTAIPGIRIGHWSDLENRTGCTVVLAGPEGAVAGVDVRGSAPGTRETDLLRPGCLVERVHAVLLSGGSAFGLAAADGVMRYLAERGVGIQSGRARVPIVPAAVIFDLMNGSAIAYPGPEQGYLACVAAEADEPGAEGQVGAATGATVGKVLGWERSAPGGLGTAALQLPSGATVWALAVVNAFGDVVDRQGAVLAGGGADAWQHLLEVGPPVRSVAGAHTTLGVVATDAALSKEQCGKLASVAHDALALAIRPVHTMFDGDTVFALSAGDKSADLTSLGAAAVETLRSAVERAVSHSQER